MRRGERQDRESEKDIKALKKRERHLKRQTDSTDTLMQREG